MKIIKLNLSQSSIQKAIEKLSNLQNDLEKSSKSITKELSDIAFNQVNKNYASSPYTDGNDDVSIISRGTENHQKVGAEGSQVLYREFGTGTEGLNAPHPIKSNFKLKGYNSGSKIRVNSKTGELFWIYKDSSGNKVYTQGIPAGKEVYNAALILKGKKISIIKKRVGEALSKL